MQRKKNRLMNYLYLDLFEKLGQFQFGQWEKVLEEEGGMKLRSFTAMCVCTQQQQQQQQNI